MECPNLYKATTRFAVVKTDSLKLYKAATRLTEVKTDSPKLCKAATRFIENKTHPQSSTRLLFALRKSNRLYDPLQHSYTLYGSQNGLSESLQDWYTLY